MKPKLILCLALVLSGGWFGGLKVAEGQTNSGLEWKTHADAARHFHFQYPSSWRLNTEGFSVEHYRDVFLSINSFGASRFALLEQEVSSNTWEFGSRTITNQLPAGAVYLDIGRWDGPWPRWGPGIHEMAESDLSAVLKSSQEVEADDLITREIGFHKWGVSWSIMVYLRPPVNEADRQSAERMLESFRFDGVPAGDAIWAIGEARKHLPPEAEPDQFTREGGSSVYYDATMKDGGSVLVMFTQHLEGRPMKTWSFRVTETGEVRPLAGEVMVLEDSQDYDGALASVMPQFEHAPAAFTILQPATSALQALPEIQKMADRPITVATEYTNWFWFSPDGFISGYAVQKDDRKVLKWNLWQR